MTGTESLMRCIVFEVPGVAQGKGRPKFTRNGPFVRAYTDKKTVSYENLVKVYASNAMWGRPPMTGPVRMAIQIKVVPPASWSKKKRELALSGQNPPTSKPDIDNVIKAIFDAMNGVVFVDDKQVFDVHVTKHYAETPEVRVCAEGS